MQPEDTPLSQRQVRPDDKWRMWEWRNSTHIRRVSINDGEIPREVHERWFDSHFPEMRDSTVIIQWKGEPIGWYLVDSWERESGFARWAYGLSDKANAFGVGAILPMLGLGHGFQRLGAKKLQGTVLEVNRNVISMFARYGIPSTGVLPERLTRADGTVTGLIGYEVLAAEWPGIFDHAVTILPRGVGAMLRAAIAAPLGE